METARVQGISLAQPATPRFSAMCRAVDEHEPIRPCRFCRVYHIIAIAITITVEPSPHSPMAAIRRKINKHSDSGARSKATRGAVASIMVACEARAPCAAPAAASGRSCPRRPALRYQSTVPIFLGDFTRPAGRCWLVVPSRGPAPARRQLFRLFTPRSIASLCAVLLNNLLFFFSKVLCRPSNLFDRVILSLNS